jgi:hypothetical protein
VTAEEAKAHSVAHAPQRHTWADRVDDADDLVSGDDRPAGVGPESFAGNEIAVAHPAGEDTYAYMAGFRFDDVALDQLKLTLSRDLKSPICRHGGP